ncbi:PilC/PilY family type IV pilus protein [Dechloromonas sp. ZS-1]|uniref:pilus assembly protein n=1 Tax=Dechloromonas sp. ZS-1 TaxID=3138067 RepID=UPI0031FC2C9A
MQREFRLKTIGLALMAAFPLMPAWAAEPYPPLPPSLSTSVAPNIVLYIDTSGSMLQDQNNAWMLTGLCNSNTNWSACVNNNTNGYRTAIDSETTSPNTKMNIAKRVARNLVNANRSLRFGVFSFRDRQADVGGNERAQSAVMRAGVRDVVSDADRDVITNAITGLYGRTATPLAEGLLEITRYYSGKTSLYGLNSGQAYSSPVQYRCQKNFAIIITDGDASNDQNLPGTGRAGEDGNSVVGAQSYTARDASGNAVSKSFSICTSSGSTTDDGYNVTCPSTYDSDGSARSFGDSSNRPSALRDVAMYANRADLRVGGNDLDNKSFDDPKFSLQNLITYTVGFAVNNAVLPSAAKVGGGKYYQANNETQLADSLKNVMSSIGDMTSNAGGLAVKSAVVGSGNKFFQPVFNPKGWYGELRCFDNTGTLLSNSLGTACSPNAKATIPAESSRKIYSSKVVGFQTTAFDFTTANLTTMTAKQQELLGSADNSALERKNVIKYVRGDTTISGYRSRANGLLGDIIDSQPLTVGPPVSVSSDLTYEAFRQTYANRGMVFIGANDGMLHGFRMSDMTEIMGYVPSSVYRNLKALKETNYGDSGGTPHAYHVNGEQRKADVKLGGAWQTLLVGGLAQGGQGYFALNATSETSLSTNAAVKWEWTDVQDSEMGYSFPTPLIYDVRTSNSTAVPAVIIANGYENDFDDTASGGQKNSAKTSALYILNAETGALLRKISVSNIGYTSQGLSSPAGVDIGQDGVLDYVYAGDINGNLWRFDLTASSPAAFSVSSAPLFQAGKPITTRPAILHVTKSADDSSLGHMIFFGTGKLQVDSDRTDTATQTVYGVLDTMSPTMATVSRSELAPRTVLDVKALSANGLRAGNYRQISTSPEFDIRSGTSSYKGWYLDLPEETERLVTTPFLLPDRLMFGTGIPKAAEKCVPGGKGWIMGLNPLTGSVTKSKYGQEFSFIDINGDSRSSDDDKISFAGGKAFASGFDIQGIPTELTWLANSSSTTMPSGAGNSGLGDAGAAIALDGANAMGVFTGGQPSGGGVTTGNPIGRPDEGGGGGGGQLCVGASGTASVSCGSGPSSSNAVRMETTLWREIK